MEELKEEARRRSCSVAAVVRDSIKAALAERKQEDRANRVMELSGKYRSGKGDLARNHDTYLEDGW